MVLRISRRVAILTLLLSITLLQPANAAKPGKNDWPSFRGINAAGVSKSKSMPVEWNVKKSKNIKWKTPIPGLAHSSPVIWGNMVFVTTAVSDDPNPKLRVGLFGESPDHPEEIPHDYRIYRLHKKTGKIIWEKSAYKGIPKVKRHIKASHDNCTPATDGKNVVAFFGSEGLYCYSVSGKLKWKKDLGILDAGPPGWDGVQWGFSSSPIIFKDMVIVLCAVRNDSFIAAYDINTGSELWKTPRVKYPGWGTPTVHVGKDRTQVIVNGYKHIGGYDVNTGKELWNMTGGGDIPVPTPIVANDLIYIANAHGPKSPVYAVKTSATGDISLKDDDTSNDHIAWSHMKVGNYMQTPLVYDGLLYCCRDSGVMSCFDARTGEKHYRMRLAGGVGFSASPVAADGKIYFTSEMGDVFVIQAGKEYKKLAKNDMGEICMATPAISLGTLFFRTQNHVIAVGK